MEWEIVHADGSKGKIKHEEALRIAEMVNGSRADRMKEINCHYLTKSGNNIVRLAGVDWGECCDLTEEAMKEMLRQYFPFSADQADLMYEIVEWAIGSHSKKVFEA